MDYLNGGRRVRVHLLTRGAIALAGAVLLGAQPARAADDEKVDFAKDVQPIFAESCVRCHQVDPNDARKKPAGNFRLDDKASALKGGRSGKAIVPGKADQSLLYKLLKGPAKAGSRNVDAMPKAMRGQKFHPLDDDKIALIKKWIDQGADWPAE